MAGEHVFIVEDDARVARLLSVYLKRHGYITTICYQGRDMVSEFEKRLPSCVFLDLNLPDTHGYELMVNIREKHPSVGIVIISGASDSVDRIVSLEMGADDFIAKPFEEREVLARLRSVLRRLAVVENVQGTQGVFEFDCYRLDLKSYSLFKYGEEVDIPNREFMLLALLLEAANRVLTRDFILDRLAGKNWCPVDRSVDVLIGKLRNRLEDSVEVRIKTIRSVGYMLVADVKQC